MSICSQTLKKLAVKLIWPLGYFSIPDLGYRLQILHVKVSRDISWNANLIVFNILPFLSFLECMSKDYFSLSSLNETNTHKKRFKENYKGELFIWIFQRLVQKDEWEGASYFSNGRLVLRSKVSDEQELSTSDYQKF